MAPPRTVGSWAQMRHSTPSTTPIPVDRRGADLVLGAPAGQGTELEEGGVRGRAGARSAPGPAASPLAVAGDVPLATTGTGCGQLLVDHVDRLGERSLVGPEGLGARVDGGGEDGHTGVGNGPGGRRDGGGSHCPRRRGKNRRHDQRSAPGSRLAPRRQPVGRPVVIRTFPASDALPGPGTGPRTPVRSSGRPVSAVVLAAGEGTRMRSARPKPLHRLCGRPMVLHVLDALAQLSVYRVVVVVGHRAEWVTKTLIEHAPAGMSIEFVEQVEPRGHRRCHVGGANRSPRRRRR